MARIWLTSACKLEIAIDVSDGLSKMCVEVGERHSGKVDRSDLGDGEIDLSGAVHPYVCLKVHLTPDPDTQLIPGPRM